MNNRLAISVIPTLLGLLVSTVLGTGCSSSTDKSDGPTLDPAAAIIKPFFRRYQAFVERDTVSFISRQGIYRLNEPVVRDYLRTVEQCGPVSPAYLANLEAHFQAIRKQLASEPQNDGEIEGLEYDLVVRNGEPDAFYATLDTAQLSLRQARPEQRLYSLRTGLPLVVKVVQGAKGWQIDSIDFDHQAQ